MRIGAHSPAVERGQDASFATRLGIVQCGIRLVSVDVQRAASGEVERLRGELAAAQKQSRQTKQPARRFRHFIWRTRDSWSRARRVVAKAEWTGGEANPRFVVTSLTREEHEARHFYEQGLLRPRGYAKPHQRVPA